MLPILFSVTLVKNIGRETSLELKIDGVDIPDIGGLTDSLGITIKDSAGNLKDRVTSGLRFQIKCKSMASVQVSDEIVSMAIPGLDYDHGSGVGYHFQVPINGDPKQINSFVVTFPQEYQISSSVRYVGLAGIPVSAPSIMVDMQTITLKGLRPYDDSELVQFKIEGISNPKEADLVMDYVKVVGYKNVKCGI